MPFFSRKDKKEKKEKHPSSGAPPAAADPGASNQTPTQSHTTATLADVVRSEPPHHASSGAGSSGRPTSDQPSLSSSSADISPLVVRHHRLLSKEERAAVEAERQREQEEQARENAMIEREHQFALARRLHHEALLNAQAGGAPHASLHQECPSLGRDGDDIDDEGNGDHIVGVGRRGDEGRGDVARNDRQRLSYSAAETIQEMEFAALDERDDLNAAASAHQTRHLDSGTNAHGSKQRADPQQQQHQQLQHQQAAAGSSEGEVLHVTLHSSDSDATSPTVSPTTLRDDGIAESGHVSRGAEDGGRFGVSESAPAAAVAAAGGTSPFATTVTTTESLHHAAGTGRSVFPSTSPTAGDDALLYVPGGDAHGLPAAAAIAQMLARARGCGGGVGAAARGGGGLSASASYPPTAAQAQKHQQQEHRHVSLEGRSSKGRHQRVATTGSPGLAERSDAGASTTASLATMGDTRPRSLSDGAQRGDVYVSPNDSTVAGGGGLGQDSRSNSRSHSRTMSDASNSPGTASPCPSSSPALGASPSRHTARPDDDQDATRGRSNSMSSTLSAKKSTSRSAPRDDGTTGDATKTPSGSRTGSAHSDRSFDDSSPPGAAGRGMSEAGVRPHSGSSSSNTTGDDLSPPAAATSPEPGSKAAFPPPPVSPPHRTGPKVAPKPPTSRPGKAAVNAAGSPNRTPGAPGVTGGASKELLSRTLSPPQKPSVPADLTRGNSPPPAPSVLPSHRAVAPGTSPVAVPADPSRKAHPLDDQQQLGHEAVGSVLPDAMAHDKMLIPTGGSYVHTVTPRPGDVEEYMNPTLTAEVQIRQAVGISSTVDERNLGLGRHQAHESVTSPDHEKMLNTTSSSSTHVPLSAATGSSTTGTPQHQAHPGSVTPSTPGAYFDDRHSSSSDGKPWPCDSAQPTATDARGAALLAAASTVALAATSHEPTPPRHHASGHGEAQTKQPSGGWVNDSHRPELSAMSVKEGLASHVTQAASASATASASAATTTAGALSPGGGTVSGGVDGGRGRCELNESYHSDEEGDTTSRSHRTRTSSFSDALFTKDVRDARGSSGILPGVFAAGGGEGSGKGDRRRRDSKSSLTQCVSPISDDSCGSTDALAATAGGGSGDSTEGLLMDRLEDRRRPSSSGSFDQDQDHLRQQGAQRQHSSGGNTKEGEEGGMEEARSMSTSSSEALSSSTPPPTPMRGRGGAAAFRSVSLSPPSSPPRGHDDGSGAHGDGRHGHGGSSHPPSHSTMSPRGSGLTLGGVGVHAQSSTSMQGALHSLGGGGLCGLVMSSVNSDDDDDDDLQNLDPPPAPTPHRPRYVAPGSASVATAPGGDAGGDERSSSVSSLPGTATDAELDAPGHPRGASGTAAPPPVVPLPLGRVTAVGLTGALSSSHHHHASGAHSDGPSGLGLGLEGAGGSGGSGGYGGASYGGELEFNEYDDEEVEEDYDDDFYDCEEFGEMESPRQSDGSAAPGVLGVPTLGLAGAGPGGLGSLSADSSGDMKPRAAFSLPLARAGLGGVPCGSDGQRLPMVPSLLTSPQVVQLYSSTSRQTVRMSWNDLNTAAADQSRRPELVQWLPEICKSLPPRDSVAFAVTLAQQDDVALAVALVLSEVALSLRVGPARPTPRQPMSARGNNIPLSARGPRRGMGTPRTGGAGNSTPRTGGAGMSTPRTGGSGGQSQRAQHLVAALGLPPRPRPDPSSSNQENNAADLSPKSLSPSFSAGSSSPQEGSISGLSPPTDTPPLPPLRGRGVPLGIPPLATGATRTSNYNGGGGSSTSSSASVPPLPRPPRPDFLLSDADKARQQQQQQHQLAQPNNGTSNSDGYGGEGDGDVEVNGNGAATPRGPRGHHASMRTPRGGAAGNAAGGSNASVPMTALSGAGDAVSGSSGSESQGHPVSMRTPRGGANANDSASPSSVPMAALFGGETAASPAPSGSSGSDDHASPSMKISTSLGSPVPNSITSSSSTGATPEPESSSSASASANRMDRAAAGLVTPTSQSSRPVDGSQSSSDRSDGGIGGLGAGLSARLCPAATSSRVLATPHVIDDTPRKAAAVVASQQIHGAMTASSPRERFSLTLMKPLLDVLLCHVDPAVSIAAASGLRTALELESMPAFLAAEAFELIIKLADSPWPAARTSAVSLLCTAYKCATVSANYNMALLLHKHAPPSARPFSRWPPTSRVVNDVTAPDRVEPLIAIIFAAKDDEQRHLFEKEVQKITDVRDSQHQSAMSRYKSLCLDDVDIHVRRAAANGATQWLSTIEDKEAAVNLLLPLLTALASGANHDTLRFTSITGLVAVAAFAVTAKAQDDAAAAEAAAVAEAEAAEAEAAVAEAAQKSTKRLAIPAIGKLTPPPNAQTSKHSISTPRGSNPNPASSRALLEAARRAQSRNGASPDDASPIVESTHKKNNDVEAVEGLEGSKSGSDAISGVLSPSSMASPLGLAESAASPCVLSGPSTSGTSSSATTASPFGTSAGSPNTRRGGMPTATGTAASGASATSADVTSQKASKQGQETMAAVPLGARLSGGSNESYGDSGDYVDATTIRGAQLHSKPRSKSKSHDRHEEPNAAEQEPLGAVPDNAEGTESKSADSVAVLDPALRSLSPAILQQLKESESVYQARREREQLQKAATGPAGSGLASPPLAAASSAASAAGFTTPTVRPVALSGDMSVSPGLLQSGGTKSNGSEGSTSGLLESPSSSVSPQQLAAAAAAIAAGAMTSDTATSSEASRAQSPAQTLASEIVAPHTAAASDGALQLQSQSGANNSDIQAAASSSTSGDLIPAAPWVDHGVPEPVVNVLLQIANLCRDQAWRVRWSVTKALPECFRVAPKASVTLLGKELNDIAADREASVRAILVSVLPEIACHAAHAAMSGADTSTLIGAAAASTQQRGLGSKSDALQITDEPAISSSSMSNPREQQQRQRVGADNQSPSAPMSYAQYRSIQQKLYQEHLTALGVAPPDETDEGAGLARNSSGFWQTPSPSAASAVQKSNERRSGSGIEESASDSFQQSLIASAAEAAAGRYSSLHETLVRDLSDEVRAAAATALPAMCRVCSANSAETLLLELVHRLLVDPSDSVRAAAARSLGDLPPLRRWKTVCAGLRRALFDAVRVEPTQRGGTGPTRTDTAGRRWRVRLYVAEQLRHFGRHVEAPPISSSAAGSGNAALLTTTSSRLHRGLKTMSGTTGVFSAGTAGSSPSNLDAKTSPDPNPTLVNGGGDIVGEHSRTSSFHSTGTAAPSDAPMQKHRDPTSTSADADGAATLRRHGDEEFGSDEDDSRSVPVGTGTNTAPLSPDPRGHDGDIDAENANANGGNDDDDVGSRGASVSTARAASAGSSQGDDGQTDRSLRGMSSSLGRSSDADAALSVERSDPRSPLSCGGTAGSMSPSRSKSKDRRNDLMLSGRSALSTGRFDDDTTYDGEEDRALDAQDLRVLSLELAQDTVAAVRAAASGSLGALAVHFGAQWARGIALYIAAHNVCDASSVQRQRALGPLAAVLPHCFTEPVASHHSRGGHGVHTPANGPTSGGPLTAERSGTSADLSPMSSQQVSPGVAGACAATAPGSANSQARSPATSSPPRAGKGNQPSSMAPLPASPSDVDAAVQPHFVNANSGDAVDLLLSDGDDPDRQREAILARIKRHVAPKSSVPLPAALSASALSASLQTAATASSAGGSSPLSVGGLLSPGASGCTDTALFGRCMGDVLRLLALDKVANVRLCVARALQETQDVLRRYEVLGVDARIEQLRADPDPDVRNVWATTSPF